MRRRWIVGTLVVLAVCGPVRVCATSDGVRDYLGPLYRAQLHALRVPRPARPRVDGTSWILRWKQIAVDASWLDHTPVTA